MRLVRAAVAVAALVLAFVGAASPSWAGGDDGIAPPTTPPAASAPTKAQVHRCTLYASANSFGASCGGGGGGKGKTWRQQLAGHAFVACHDVPVPAGVKIPDPPQDAKPGGAYWLETCVKDFDVDMVGGGPGSHTETTLVWIDGPGEVLTIPPWMDWLWQTFDSAYPTPLLTTGPTAYPRVNVPTYFWLAPSTAAPISKVVFDGVEDITLRAEMVRLQVRPGVKAGEKPIECGDGTTTYDTARSPFQQASDCTWTYLRSSASLPDEAYPVRANAYWRVGYTNAAGGYTQLGLFDVSTVQLLPVQEVQAVVER